MNSHTAFYSAALLSLLGRQNAVVHRFPAISLRHIISLTSALCKPIGLRDTVIQHRPALHLLTLPANKM
jgi:hypothetical protein